jgi:hypothetical protein
MRRNQYDALMKLTYCRHMTVVGAMAVCVLCGCKKASEKISETIIEKSAGPDTKVDLQDGKVTVNTKEGQIEVAVEGSVKMPSDFPADIPLVKGAKLISSMKMPQGFSLAWQSAEPSDKVTTQYADELKAQGWTEESNMAMGEDIMAQFKKDERSVTLVVTKEKKGCVIQLTTANE